MKAVVEGRVKEKEEVNEWSCDVWAEWVKEINEENFGVWTQWWKRLMNAAVEYNSERRRLMNEAMKSEWVRGGD